MAIVKCKECDKEVSSEQNFGLLKRLKKVFLKIKDKNFLITSGVIFIYFILPFIMAMFPEYEYRVQKSFGVIAGYTLIAFGIFLIFCLIKVEIIEKYFSKKRKG